MIQEARDALIKQHWQEVGAPIAGHVVQQGVAPLVENKGISAELEEPLEQVWVVERERVASGGDATVIGLVDAGALLHQGGDCVGATGKDSLGHAHRLFEVAVVPGESLHSEGLGEDLLRVHARRPFPGLDKLVIARDLRRNLVLCVFCKRHRRRNVRGDVEAHRLRQLAGNEGEHEGKRLQDLWAVLIIRGLRQHRLVGSENRDGQDREEGEILPTHRRGVQANEGALPVCEPSEARVRLEVRAIKRRDPKEAVSQGRVFDYGESPDGSVESPEHWQLEQQGQDGTQGIDLQVHIQEANFLLQSLLVVLVLGLQLVYAGRQHLDLGCRLELPLHEGVQGRPDEEGVHANR
mmetsp:Transcript_73731/g.158184  ORF Transcript_73731/g.158184 Transcript_73731/m.158184 type:complete len:351 (+) Transcript_73731:682-1734(+)